METVDGQFTGQAGVPIHWQAWSPTGPVRAVVVVAHGFGEHIGRYGNLVDAVVPRGYAVYGPDHRGHGRSGGHRALIDRHEHLLADLDEVVLRAANAHPGRPVFLLGHSMGGNIALGYALAHPDRLAGLVLSGPAVTTAGVAWPLRQLARVLGRVSPRLGVTALAASGVSSDPAVVAAYEADPLVFHGRMPAGTGAALLATAERYPDRLPSLTLPLLVVHGSADTLVSVESGRTAHALAGSADKTLRIYEGFAHEVMNEPGRAEVLADIVDWLDARTTAPAP